jgi:hypothetical protein
MKICAQCKRQVRTALSTSHPSFRIDPLAIAAGQLAVETVLQWLSE